MSIGGSDSGSNSNQTQAFANSSTGNQAGQYANGPINSGQLQGALDSGQGMYNMLGQVAAGDTAMGLQHVRNSADAGMGLENASNGALSDTLSGSYLSAGNPYFSNMVGQIGQAVAPQVDSHFAANGRYGSGANANAFASALTNQAGQLAYQNYGAERGNQMSATNNMPSYLSGMTAPGQALMTAGYSPLNQFTQQLAALKPGTAGSYGQSSGANTAGNNNAIGTGDQSTFGVNTKSK